MSELRQQLDYAPATKSTRLRGRLVIFVCVLLSLILLGVLTGPPLFRFAKHRWLLWQCNRYTFPANTVVFEDDPLKVGNLISTGRYVSSYRNWMGLTPFALLPTPEFTAYAGQGHLLLPVVFMHELISPDGTRRLVAIQYCRNQSGEIFFYPHVDQASAATPKPMRLQMLRNPTETITLYGGQLDPNDRSHFTIDYTLNSLRETIDGWLHDDGTVRLVPRCGDVVWWPHNSGVWSPGNASIPERTKMIGVTALGHTNAAPTSRPASTVPDPIPLMNQRWAKMAASRPATAPTTR